MAVDEKQRHDLMTSAEEVFGPVQAETLMNLLPPVGWADVATKHDLAQLQAATKADIDNLRAATKADIDNLRAATKADIEHLREYVDERFERARAEWRGDLEHGLRTQLLAFLSANTVLLGIFVTIVQLLD